MSGEPVRESEGRRPLRNPYECRTPRRHPCLICGRPSRAALCTWCRGVAPTRYFCIHPGCERVVGKAQFTCDEHRSEMETAVRETPVPPEECDHAGGKAWSKGRAMIAVDFGEDVFDLPEREDAQLWKCRLCHGEEWAALPLRAQVQVREQHGQTGAEAQVAGEREEREDGEVEVEEEAGDAGPGEEGRVRFAGGLGLRGENVA